MSKDHTAEAIIGKQRFRARIEQHDGVAFVSVIGAGNIDWCKVHSADAYGVMLHVAGGGEVAMPPGDAAILRTASAVFAGMVDDDPLRAS